jgi:hypothetical protein
MDERTLCARLKSWVDAEIERTGYGPLTGADTEVHASGSHLRHDLLIYAGNRIAFSCEVKLPTNPQGTSPYNPTVVADARRKAEAEGLAYFGTTNCASFVMWKVDQPNVPVDRRDVDDWRILPPELLGSIDSPGADQAFQKFVVRLLATLALIEVGVPPGETRRRQPEDELVARIEGSLDTIVGLTYPDVRAKFLTDEAFRRKVKRWMIQDQGWQWDDQLQNELLLRATKMGCYLQMNRLLFYSTMRARFPELEQLDVENARSGRGLRQRLEPYFERAIAVARDYETVFHVGETTEFAYAGDAATGAWTGLVKGLEGVDLATVGLDVLGGIFERLLSPEERHRFGQHYTSPELVDLLVASSVTDRVATVFDPASGGGTFLVRAYERLRYLGETDHLVLLSQIYGNDLSRFAGHLSTVNLAARQVSREQNYPRIGTHNFFDLDPGDDLISLPVGPGDPPARVAITSPLHVSAVVANPPYVRRQSIDEPTRASAEHAVTKYGVGHSRPGFRLDGLSDLHVYFWPQATRYLAPGGYLAFLTSSAWLQTRYGEKLKELLLNDYEILFLAETESEPWFSDARVKTVATVARKRALGTDVAADQEVAFVQFQKPLAALFGPASAFDRWRRVDEVVNKIGNGVSTDEMKVRKIRQVDLRSSDDWSPYLRAPAIYDKLISLPGVRPICSASPSPEDPYDLQVGPKFGSSWFIVTDVTEAATEDDLEAWGLSARQVTGSRARFRIVRGGDWRGPVESRYLKRWVRGPGDEATRTISRSAGDLAITIPRDLRLPRTAKIHDYIRYGEEQGEHRRVYVSSRGSQWYSVDSMDASEIIFPYSMQYGHKVWENPRARTLTTSPSAYITPKDTDSAVALALLNSTWTYLAALFDAGAVGTEGLVRFGGRGSWRRLHVVDPRRASEAQADRLRSIWQLLRAEPVEPFPPEGDELLGGVRRELDELTLQVAGVTDRVDASELVDELYRWLPRYNQQRSDVEAMAVSGRQSRSGTVRFRRIVEQSAATIDVKPDWLGEVDALWTVTDLPSQTPDTSAQPSLLGLDGQAEQLTDIRFGSAWVRFESVEQADFVRSLASARLAPRRLAVPPAARAGEYVARANRFVETMAAESRSAISERVSEDDPGFAPAFIQVLGQVAGQVRTQLHVQG